MRFHRFVDFQGSGGNPACANGLFEGERKTCGLGSAAIAWSVTHCILPERQDQGSGSLTLRKRQRIEGQGKIIPLYDCTTETFRKQRLQHIIERAVRAQVATHGPSKANHS